MNKDSDEAKWYGKLADSGQAEGDFGMASIYLMQGQQDTIKYVDATKWMRRAAEKNYALAQNNLAVMHANGYGVERDQETLFEDRDIHRFD